MGDREKKEKNDGARAVGSFGFFPSFPIAPFFLIFLDASPGAAPMTPCRRSRRCVTFFPTFLFSLFFTTFSLCGDGTRESDRQRTRARRKEEGAFQGRPGGLAMVVGAHHGMVETVGGSVKPRATQRRHGRGCRREGEPECSKKADGDGASPRPQSIPVFVHVGTR
ncbi:hypothetical protein [Pandoravirus japonicus]|uniref:Transmembrane protein n=1 Tax=Pandoravirus japonicus TaxID=2823154 RepID=A0A811BRJ1_9VIRU|nr:hypothetical protein [Pandoravirus japonicus]